jgi:hypothetical protein
VLFFFIQVLDVPTPSFDLNPIWKSGVVASANQKVGAKWRKTRTCGMEEKPMRAKSYAVARLLPSGLLLPLVLALGACETSPTEQLSRAETMFSRLESKGADQYLIYQMAEIRRGIEIARKDIRNNRLETAYRSLYGICERLDSCGTAFMHLRKKAAAESKEQTRWVGQELVSLEQAVLLLPRQTYVDQNRYDIQVHRLRRYQQELVAMEALILDEDFQKALEKGYDLVQQVKYMQAGLKPTLALARKNKNTARPPQPLAPTENAPAATSVLATMAR